MSKFSVSQRRKTSNKAKQSERNKNSWQALPRQKYPERINEFPSPLSVFCPAARQIAYCILHAMCSKITTARYPFVNHDNYACRSVEDIWVTTTQILEKESKPLI